MWSQPSSCLKTWRPCFLRKTHLVPPLPKLGRECQARAPSSSNLPSSSALPHPSGKFCLPDSPHGLSTGVPYHFPWPFRAHNSPGHSTNPSLQRPTQKAQGCMGLHSVCQARTGIQALGFPTYSYPRLGETGVLGIKHTAFPKQFSGHPSQWPRLSSPQALCCTASWETWVQRTQLNCQDARLAASALSVTLSSWLPVSGH